MAALPGRGSAGVSAPVNGNREARLRRRAASGGGATRSPTRRCFVKGGAELSFERAEWGSHRLFQGGGIVGLRYPAKRVRKLSVSLCITCAETLRLAHHFFLF